MSDYHCLEIEIIDVDFDSYYIKSEIEISKTFHAHLYTEKEDIELKIFYSNKSYLGEKLMTWISKIDLGKFGTYIKVELTKNHTNNRLQRVDLSGARFIGVAKSTNYYEDGKYYILVKINTVKLYWNPVEHNQNTAEFYLDAKGFSIVEHFYNSLLPETFYKNDGKFEIRRRNDSSEFYKLEKSTFRPEYNFVSKDNQAERVATVTKEPKIQFIYEEGVTESESVLYGDIVLMLASFYHHIKIDYVLRRINLPDNTIVIKNVERKKLFDAKGDLGDFGINWDFNKFLQSSWQEKTVKNFTLLSKIIALFNQSHLVDSHSAYLIRYNIIEICDIGKQANVKFEHILSPEQTKAQQDKALTNLLETINKSEHEQFKKRWQHVQELLQNKPMTNRLVSFLISQNLDPETFSVKFTDLKKLRDNITH